MRRMSIPAVVAGLMFAIQLPGASAADPNEAQFKPAPPGVFAQFYPVMKGRIPKEALEKALAEHGIR